MAGTASRRTRRRPGARRGEAAEWPAPPSEFEVGINQTRKELGVSDRALRTAWRRHGLGLPPRPAATAAASRRLDGAFVALLTQMWREGARQGVGGLVDDWIALSLPWGFALADIKLPVSVWQGELDHLVGPAHAHYFSAVLPNATLVLYPQDGHLLLLQHWDEILAAVSAGAETKDPAAGRHEGGGRAAPQ